MKIKGVITGLFLFLFAMGAEVHAGTFEGTVTDNTGAPVENVIVTLVDEQGDTQQTTTLVDGSYQFTGLITGWYTVYIVTPVGYILIDPPCGFHFKYVPTGGKAKGHFGLKAQSSGVVVEFGKPGGKSANGVSRVSIKQSQFLISLYLSNLVTLTPPYPKTITIIGYWAVPGYGKIQLEGLFGHSAGLYKSKYIDVHFDYLSQQRMAITLTTNQWPFFSLDGEAASLKFAVISGLGWIQAMGGQLIFCLETITLENNGALIPGSFWPFIGIFK